MAFQNLTPFPAISWESVDSKKQWHMTTLVRVKYVFHPLLRDDRWELRLTPDQGELFARDVHYTDNEDYPVRYESDFVTYKKHTDIIVNGVAQSAKGHPESQDDCGVIVADSNRKVILQHKINLSGHRPWTASPGGRNYPTGSGFVHRESESRLEHAGTYDEHWINNQHPYPPEDYDYLYNQAACPGLILQGIITSGAIVGLYNLIKAGENNSFIIPDLRCFSELVSDANEVSRTPMNIDTLLIDIEDDNPEKWAVYLSYRSFVPKLYEPKEMKVKYLPVDILEKQYG